ncbi:MAG: hypothetical protein ABIJ18_00430 [archaeon]
MENKKYFKPGKTNEEDRINFIKYWVDFMKNNKDEVWSEQQNSIINSQIKDYNQGA